MTYKNIRTYVKPIKDFPGAQQEQSPPMQLFAESRLNQGLVTIIDPADIPTGAVQEALNYICRYDKLIVRSGSVQFALNGEVISVPDINPVLAIRTFETQDTTAYTLRFTNQSVFVLGNQVWLPITGPALSGQVTDRFSTALIFNTMVFTNNGANPLMAINLISNTYGPIAAPQQVATSTNFRYITGFDNRIVGAAIPGSNEVYIGWSGNGPTDNVSIPGSILGYTQFDAAVDQTAGNSPLEDSPSDLSDPIKGLFGFTNVMLVLREKSLWMCTKQPIPTDPFNFFTYLPNIGCNCPYSAQIIDDGVAWLDQRKGTVYYFEPGSGIQPIGRPIENIVFNGLDSLTDIFSAYDPDSGDYSIFVPQAGSSMVKGYTYNFKSQCWTRSEYDNMTCAENVNIQSGELEIIELVGTIINLQGQIKDLVRATSNFYTRAYGNDDGTIVVEDPLAQNDRMTTNSSGDGTPFTATLISKDFKMNVVDATFAKILIEYTDTLGSTGALYYNKKSGADNLQSPNWKLAKTFSTDILAPDTDLITWNNQIRSRRMAWRLDITGGGGFAVYGYEVHYFPSGMQKPAGLG